MFALVLLIIIPMIMPLCHAVTHIEADAFTTHLSGAGQNTAPVEPASDEPCWFAEAHIFNANLTPGAPDITHAYVFVLLWVFVAVIRLPRPPAMRQWCVPRRSPPTRALLQIFRN